MNGYEVAGLFRADQTLRSVFLVSLTGYALPEDRAKAQEAGFNRHLAKPVSVEKLEQVLAGVPCERGRNLSATSGKGDRH
jgi:CheY-like chemotaxis protein